MDGIAKLELAELLPLVALDLLVGDSGMIRSSPGEERARLMQRSPHNVVRLLQPQGGDDSHTDAAQSLRDWKVDGSLQPDPEPRLYLYEMEYFQGVERRRARGVIGALLVEPLGRRILPHEETGSHRQARHLAVLRAMAANLDPIMVLSGSPHLGALLQPAGSPRLEFEADGVHHRLYDILDAARISAISEQIEAHGASIADGHHRYSTALSYRRELEAEAGAGPWSAIMAMVCPAEGSGLHVGPFHRTFTHFSYRSTIAAELFEVFPAEPRPPQMPGELTIVTREGSPERLQPRPEALISLPEPWREASTAVLRELLYPLLGLDQTDATYDPNATRAVEAVRQGRFEGAVLTAPISERAIALASEEGIRFPQKSTYFTPKPRAGLVIRFLTE